MWKWIVGSLLALVVVIAAFCYVAVKKFTAGGDAAVVTIAGTPERVFAALADVDSMPVWMASGSVVTATHRGMLTVGDTVHVESGKSSRTRQDMVWLVSDVTPGRLLVLQMRDSTGSVFATRRDSLSSESDSTRIVSTIASPMIDSIKTTRGDTGGKVGGALLDFGSKMLISGFRALTEQDLKRLKAHIEKAAPAKP